MARVLRPGGRILWYDMRSIRPTANLVPIDRQDVRALFPGFSIAFRAVTLRWGLVHRVVPRSRAAGLLLSRFPALCSHDVAVMQRVVP